MRPPVKRYLKPSTPARGQTAHNKFWPWIVVAAVLLLLGLAGWYGLSARASSAGAPTQSSQSQAVPTPTFTPTPPQIPASSWRTLQTFSGPTTGNATKRTQKFTVPATTWQITWACQGVNGVDEWLYIAIYNADGTLYNSGAQVTCVAAKKVLGSAVEGKSGTFYLTIDASTSWTITVQALK